MTHPAWRLRVLPPARRQLDRLPESAAGAVLETMQAIRENPRRIGKPLTLGLAGLFSARRGPYRVIYEIDDAERVVRVVTIGHRPLMRSAPPADDDPMKARTAGRRPSR